MALLKCKMCGGNLEVADNVTVCECEYCGTQQTLPKNHDDIAANLFNRANNLRIKSEFDKAQEIYEKIVSSNPDEAEAYWGIILCKYGIEYVEDPATFTKVPTCHRTQLESVRSDSDYLAALEHADAVQRAVYEKEALAIDKLQKDILDIVHNEKPFDVFICYKETDENGRRTPDSVIANDIYHQLTAEGFKVFYAAITLEDKLGQAYEPYIFAALNSAKVMLSLGTRPEYFNAVWVRNEWGRYLKLMKQDRSRLLIPCYKDMDAYDLPEEFSHLQAQDMGKIGFISDIIRGIKKVLQRDSAVPLQQAAAAQAPVQQTGLNIEPLLKRAFMFLEDGDWQTADEYCEKVLDMDPECARAYLGKLMAKCMVRVESELPYISNRIDPDHKYLKDFDLFKKIYRFANDDLKIRMDEYSKENMYLNCVNVYKNADNIHELLMSADILESLGEYKDSVNLADECRKLYNETMYNDAHDMMNSAKNEQELLEAARLFEIVGDYNDAADYVLECKRRYNELRFNKLVAQYCTAETDLHYRAFASALEELPDYPPAVEKRNYCLEQAEIYVKYEAKYQSAIPLLKSTVANVILEGLTILAEILDYKESRVLYERAQSRYLRIIRTSEYQEKTDAIRNERKLLTARCQNLGFFDGAIKKQIAARLAQLAEMEKQLDVEYADIINNYQMKVVKGE